MTESCGFTFEGDEEQTVDEWECPHDIAEVSDEYCLFHLEEDEREQVNDQKIADEFLNCVCSSGRETKQFIGARIETLDVTFQHLDSPDNHPIDLRFATIGTLTADYADIQQPLLMKEADIRHADFRYSEFGQLLKLNSSSLPFLDCSSATFQAEVEIHSSNIAIAIFSDAVFEKSANLSQTTFDIGARFHSVKFCDPAIFQDTVFNSPFTNIDEQDSEDKVWLEHHLSIGPLLTGRKAVDDKHWIENPILEQEPPEQEQIYYSERNFVNENFVHFNDTHLNGADFREAVFEGRAVFDGSKFEYADFGNARFNGRASFVGVQAFGCLYFHASEFENIEMRVSPIDVQVVYNEDSESPTYDLRNKGRIYLTEATIYNGQIRQPSDGEMFYDVANGTVGDIDLVSRSNSFEHFIVRNTDFEGFDFTEYHDDLRAIDWQIDGINITKLHDSIPPSKSDRETTYMKAKEGAAQVGDNTAQSEFFQKEMSMRAHRYQVDFDDDDSVIDETANMLGSMAHITANLFYRLTCGYGEKPYRVIASYVAITLIFSTTLMLPNLVEGTPSLFVRGVWQVSQTLAFGRSVENPAWFANIVGTFRTFVIPIFIALLVFTLSRSIDR